MNVVLSIFFLRYKDSQAYLYRVLKDDTKNCISIMENWNAVVQNAGISLKAVQDNDECVKNLKRLFRQNGSDKLFICRFSELNCEKCIDYAIDVLQSSYEVQNVVFLADYHDKRILKCQIQKYGIDSIRVMNVREINLPIEALNKPYFFLLDSTLNVCNVFIPDKVSGNMKQKYFDMIKDKCVQ